MKNHLSHFMGFQETDQTEMNNLWLNILSKMLGAMDQYFDLKSSDFNTFSEYVSTNLSTDVKNAYFWEWMKDNGISFIKKTDKVLPNTEDIQDFLKYREMLLEMDIESGSINNLILSITELCKTTADFIESYLESAATDNTSHTEYSEIRIPMNSPYKNYILDENWKVLGVPAKIEAGLFL